MILQASFRHELIHQKPIISLYTIANEFNQIWMTKLAKVINFSLQSISDQLQGQQDQQVK